MSRVTIIDYGIGNILSVSRAFEYWGAEVDYAETPDQIVRAERLILPGVGAFKDGMKQLQDRNLVSAIHEYCEQDKPFLGICLGMQMMLSESEEFGITQGLNLIPGKVTLIENMDVYGDNQKVPHVGWNELVLPMNSTSSWKGSLLEHIEEYSSTYFVHSFTARPTDDNHRLADTFYGRHQISAVIRKGNLYGAQFHPEKSGMVGLKIIKNFLSLL